MPKSHDCSGTLFEGHRVSDSTRCWIIREVLKTRTRHGPIAPFSRLQLVTSCKCVLAVEYLFDWQWLKCGGVSWKHKVLFGGFLIMQVWSVVSDHVVA